MKLELRIPSPVHTVIYQGIELLVKRDDLIHEHISGNKWRKLKYNIEQMLVEGKHELLTFGGAHSNHIAATAFAGKLLKLNTVGVIRGGPFDEPSPTLQFAEECGMHLQYISRSEYKDYTQTNKQYAIADYQYLVPEGGANELGVGGCEEILNEVIEQYDVVCVDAGTGATAAGIIRSSSSPVVVVPVLKGEDFLRSQIEGLVKKKATDWQSKTNYHFGGYAKTTPVLLEFMNSFYEETGIKTDPVYTGKLFYAVVDMIQRGELSGRVLVIHTGGLQGIPAMEQRLGKKIF